MVFYKRQGWQRQGWKQFSAQTTHAFYTVTPAPNGKRVREDRICLVEMAIVDCGRDEPENSEC